MLLPGLDDLARRAPPAARVGGKASKSPWSPKDDARLAGMVKRKVLP